jgi:hypothetical protein
MSASNEIILFESAVAVPDFSEATAFFTFLPIGQSYIVKFFDNRFTFCFRIQFF